MLLIFFAVVFGVSAYMYISGEIRSHREAKGFEELRAQITKKGPLNPNSGGNKPEQIPSDTPAGQLPQQPEEPEEPAEPEPTVSPYLELYNQNSDLFGWVTIEGTQIDYPVMFTPDDPEYYIHRDFDGTTSASGVPFMDGNCFENCGNYLIYGHNMKNGTMFAALKNYTSRDFWLDHQIIRFDTVEEAAEYQVIAAFYSRVYQKTDTDVFRYYNYTALGTQEVFDEYMSQVRTAAAYDTGITASFGDQLLTLSTCSYHTGDGRFVVVAKKIASQEYET